MKLQLTPDPEWQLRETPSTGSGNGPHYRQRACGWSRRIVG